jgi:chromosomal replication initiation ATPase DnaA
MVYDRLQTGFAFPHHPRYSVHDFIAGECNREALTWLEAVWPEQRLALFGPAGCGKSHLLHVWAKQAGAVLLGGQTLLDLEGVPASGALVLDDADTVRDETLLLHLLNTARDRGMRLLLSGRIAPARWPVRLPDLSSRLRAITAAEIGPPDDNLLAALCLRLVADRQMVVSPSVQAWLLRHLPRSPAALREALVRLDRASLVAQAPITRAMAVRVLAAELSAAAGRDEGFASGGDAQEDANGDPSCSAPRFL